MRFTINEIEQKKVQELTVNIADSTSAVIDISNTDVTGVFYQAKTFINTTQTVTPSKILGYATTDGSGAADTIIIDERNCDIPFNNGLLANSVTPSLVIDYNKIGVREVISKKYLSIKYIFNANVDGAVIYIVPLNTACVNNPVR